MIKYALRCDKGHDFDSWFKDSKSFDRLAKAGALRCADCGSAKVAKQIMAPAIPRKGRSAAPAARAPESSGPETATPPAAPETAPAAPDPAMHVAGKMREALRELRRHVEKTADYVGPKFAEEARAMHQGDKEERSIYGEATEKEAEALRDDGIPFGRIPWAKHKHDA